jgi:hypothetical protein
VVAGPNERSGGLGEPDDVQQEECADNSCNQQAEDTSARNAEQTEYPDSDEGTNHSDDQIANETEPGALHDFASEESGDNPDDEKKQQVFSTHLIFSFVGWA